MAPARGTSTFRVRHALAGATPSPPVTRNRSLDEFLGGKRTESAEGGGEPDGAEGEDSGDGERQGSEPEEGADRAGDTSATGEAVGPARSTYAFAPAGAPCTACGAVVERRWRDEQGLVCPDCKVW